MKSTMKLKRLKDADKVSETLKGSMFFLRGKQNLQKVFLSALALHKFQSVLQWCSKGKFTGEIEMRGILLLGKFFEDTLGLVFWLIVICEIAK